MSRIAEWLRPIRLDDGTWRLHLLPPNPLLNLWIEWRRRTPEGRH